MNVNTAVIHLKNAAAPSEKPLMLRELLFCPVLTWVCQELSARGVERFFIVCDEAWQEEQMRQLQHLRKRSPKLLPLMWLLVIVRSVRM